MVEVTAHHELRVAIGLGARGLETVDVVQYCSHRRSCIGNLFCICSAVDLSTFDSLRCGHK